MKLLILLGFLGSALAVQNRYDNYQVISLHVANQQQHEAALELEKIGYLYMDPPTGVGYRVDVIVPPHKQAEFSELVERLEFKSKVMTPNLQSLIDNEGQYRGARAALDWEAYYPLEDIYSWLDTLIEEYPQVTGFVAGSTYEGREIRGIKISFREGNEAVFFESNIHAREWITSATSTWIINHLLTSDDPETRNLAETVDWYFVPIFNPDGFVYTHTTNRLWRKTRSPSPSSTCFGADPNRNWGYFWRTGGSSNDPCSDTYAGSRPFSEVETATIADFYTKLVATANVTAYFDFHSYSQLLMYPFGTTLAGRIGNEDEHIQVGQAMARAIEQRYGTQYEFGNIVPTIYVASGGSHDWVKGVRNTPFTLLYEFRDTGRFGFILPADQIIPNALEVWDSLLAFFKEARTLGYFSE